jgi:hypothetical protein
LIKRFFFGVGLLDQAGDDRFNVAKAKFVLGEVVTTDFVKLSDIPEGGGAICVGIDFGAISGETRLSDHAARSIP